MNLKNYSGMIAMVGAVAAGAVVGILWKDVAAALKPIGDVFLNLLFVLVVPLVFFSVSTSFASMMRGGSLGRTLLRTVGAFAVIWVAGAVVAYVGGLVVNPLPDGFVPDAGRHADVAIPDGATAFVNALSVGDFPQLFSKFSLLPLILFSALLGSGVAAAGQKGEPFSRFLESGGEVVVKTLGILMKAAPAGLGCYFAGTISSFGGDILRGYLRVLLVYCAVFSIMFFLVYPLLVSLRKKDLRIFWKSIAKPSVIALATSSSSAAMPSNIEAAHRIGVGDGASEAVVPLATNLLKAGSVMCNVYKIMFLLLLSGGTVATLPAALTIIGVAILAAIVSGAVTNGGVSGDILTCSILGADPSLVGIIMIIGTIVDIPATVLNSQSTVVAAVLSEKR